MGATWVATDDSGLLCLAGRWLPHEIGTIERIAWPLTRSGNCFIVRGIPEGHMFKEISLIWEIQIDPVQGHPSTCSHSG